MRETAALGQTDAETEGDEPGLRVPFLAGARGLSRDARARLRKLVVFKLALDLLFVSALAVYFQADAFHPFFSGALDSADERGVRGWVVDRARPGEPVEVQLYVDGKFFADGFADRPRPDVSEKGYARDERHGFVFDFAPPPAGRHEARVYALHASRGDTRRTLQQIGSAFGFDSK